MVTALANATTAVSKEISDRSALNNSPAMQKALVYHRMQAELDQHRQEIADEDLAAVRLMLATPEATPTTPN